MTSIAFKQCKGKILDIGAGTGDHALYLQNNGFDVTAMDNSPYCCEIMKKRGISNVICSDFFSYECMVKFDTILLLGRSIGAVGDYNGYTDFLIMAEKILNDSGQIVFNSVNEPSKSQWQTRQLQFEYDGVIGEPAKWFDIGEEALIQSAIKNRYLIEIKISQTDGNYLAVLQKKSEYE